jgi:hypothetical protein
MLHDLMVLKVLTIIFSFVLKQFRNSALHIIIYRIDPGVTCNSNGPPDEVYVCRQGGLPLFTAILQMHIILRRWEELKLMMQGTSKSLAETFGSRLSIRYCMK